MKTLEALLADLRTCAPADVVDCAAEALGVAGEDIAHLAEQPGYDTVTLWWAAGALSQARAAVLPHTVADPVQALPSVDFAAEHAELLADVVSEAVGALDRAARAAAEPDRIHDLARAAGLGDRARRAFSNARVVAS